MVSECSTLGLIKSHGDRTFIEYAAKAVKRLEMQQRIQQGMKCASPRISWLLMAYIPLILSHDSRKSNSHWILPFWRIRKRLAISEGKRTHISGSVGMAKNVSLPRCGGIAWQQQRKHGISNTYKTSAVNMTADRWMPNRPGYWAWDWNHLHRWSRHNASLDSSWTTWAPYRK